MEIDAVSQEQMIQDLNDVGIEVKPVLMAFVPQEFGTSNRVDEIVECMSLEKAYRKISNRRLLPDPFTK